MTGFGFLSSIVAKQNCKKRKREEVMGTVANLGRVVFKFKEGHSKNFKRQLDFNYFL